MHSEEGGPMDVRSSIVDLFVQRLSEAGVQAQGTVAAIKELLANGVQIEDSKLIRYIEDCTDDSH